jgi:C_GCAxxG_C_C family probable redox protein
MTDRIEQASAYFKQGFSCAQSVLAAFAPSLGLDTETALRVAGAFGGGIAQRGDLCGAVSGALMVLGLRYGRTRPEDQAAKDTTYRQANEFMRRFSERHGTFTCRELLNCDVSDAQELERARREGLFTLLCPSFVRDAAEIVEELI